MYQITKRKILPAVATVLFVGSTVFLSSAAAQKIMHSIPFKQGQVKSVAGNGPVTANPSFSVDEAQANNGEHPADGGGKTQPWLSIQSAGEGSSAPLESAAENNSQAGSATLAGNTGLNNQSTLTQNSQNSSSTFIAIAAGNTFTLAALAAHNKAGDCYIAYKGKVYNLSNSAVWANCRHHGVSGGIDITSIFPHPVSYFDTLPVAGTLAAVNSQNLNPINPAPISGSVSASASTGSDFRDSDEEENSRKDDDNDTEERENGD